MNSQLLVLVAAAYVLSLSSEAFAFKCYVCNSRNDTACAKTPLDPRFLRDCNEISYENNKEKHPFIVCRHQIIETNGVVTHDRRCGWKMYAKKREVCLSSADAVVKTTACECHTEACNSSSSLAVSAMTVAAALLSVLFIRH